MNQVCIKSSENLLEFYKDWLAWAESEPTADGNFRRYVGLCGNLHVWAGELSYGTRVNMQDELNQQFEIAGLAENYPFGKDKYYKDVQNDTMYTCPKRLKWVRDRIKDMEK